MNTTMLEEALTRIFKRKLRAEMNNTNWGRDKLLLKDLLDVFSRSDLTEGELCDALEISIDRLAELLERAGRPAKPRRIDVWEQNLTQGLPLFVPVRLRGLT